MNAQEAKDYASNYIVREKQQNLQNWLDVIQDVAYRGKTSYIITNPFADLLPETREELITLGYKFIKEMVDVGAIEPKLIEQERISWE